MGCVVLDKGMNQFNKFLDVMSLEFMLLWFLDGWCDDGVQVVYIWVMIEFWGDFVNNLQWVVFGCVVVGCMIEMDCVYVWVWDVWLYLVFLVCIDFWLDGFVWECGYWLNGCVGVVFLVDVVVEFCCDVGVWVFDILVIYGLVKGYVISGQESGCVVLQLLMLLYGFDVVECDGVLGFWMCSVVVDVEFVLDDMVMIEDLLQFEVLCVVEVELLGRLWLIYIEVGSDYLVCMVEICLLGGDFLVVFESELLMVLMWGEGQVMVECWILEMMVVWDGVCFVFFFSLDYLGFGDVVCFFEGWGEVKCWCIDCVECVGVIMVDVVRVEFGIYCLVCVVEGEIEIWVFQLLIFVWLVFLDLLLLWGDEIFYVLYFVVMVMFWLGLVVVWVLVEQVGGYKLNMILFMFLVMGEMLLLLVVVCLGVWDLGVLL